MTVLSLVTPQGQCRALRAKSMATSFANLATHRFTCRSLPLHLFHFFIRLFRCLEAFVSFSFPHFTSPFLGYLPFSWDIPALSALLFSRLEYFPSISITLCFKSSTACPTTWRNLLGEGGKIAGIFSTSLKYFIMFIAKPLYLVWTHLVTLHVVEHVISCMSYKPCYDISQCHHHD